MKCVSQDEAGRKFQAPFPMLDLSGMLYAKGINPLEERKKLSEDMERTECHNALGDVLMSIEIYKKIFKKETVSSMY